MYRATKRETRKNMNEREREKVIKKNRLMSVPNYGM